MGWREELSPSSLWDGMEQEPLLSHKWEFGKLHLLQRQTF